MTSLVAQRVGETLIDQCHRCGGVWVEASMFDRLIQSHDQRTAIVGNGAHLQVERVGSPAGSNKVHYLPCPECAQLMNRKNFAHISGVIVDVCTAHGVWFDRDELGRVIQFVNLGGLDAARKVECQSVQRQQRMSLDHRAGAALDDAHPTWVDDLVRAFRDWTR